MTIATVSLRVPPDADHVPLLRTTIAGVAARADFTLEQVEDLRMAIEEAAVTLMRLGSGEPIELDVTVEPDALVATIGTRADGDVDDESFSWRILATLADEVHAASEGEERHIVLRKVAHR